MEKGFGPWERAPGEYLRATSTDPGVYGTWQGHLDGERYLRLFLWASCLPSMPTYSGVKDLKTFLRGDFRAGS